MKGRELAKDGETNPRDSLHRPISYLRFSVQGEGSHSEQVSTLPPPPFEHETDVARLEWWLEAHMSLAGGQLCVEQAMTADDASAQAVSTSLESVRDALYEMYCDAADPRMRDTAMPEGTLGAYVRALYTATEEVVAFMLDADRDRGRAHALADKLSNLPRLPERWMAPLGIDAESPLEPLRNLGRDVTALSSAVTRLAEVLRGT